MHVKPPKRIYVSTKSKLREDLTKKNELDKIEGERAEAMPRGMKLAMFYVGMGYGTSFATASKWAPKSHPRDKLSVHLCPCASFKFDLIMIWFGCIVSVHIQSMANSARSDLNIVKLS
jgi:hypothetical protein